MAYRSAFGVGLLAAATLLAELTWTRLFSVTHVHVFAFLAVSTAMLGTAVGARVAGSRSPAFAGRAATAFALGVPLAHVLSQTLELDLARLEAPETWVRLLLLYLFLAAPFAAAGAAIADQLSRAPAVGTVYGADLIGAALGSLSALLLIPTLAAVPVLWVAAGLGAAAALALGSRAGGVALILVGTGAATVTLPLHIPASKRFAGRPVAEVLGHRTVWTPHARVDEVQTPEGAWRLLLDAGVAAVRIPTSTPTLSDATLPYELRPGARVLVVGAGAGWEVAEALAFGAREVVGVEVNGAVLEATPPSIRRAARLVHDDARSFLERGTEPFDVAIMVHTISNAATAAGALGLTEDHLLTVEAFERIWARLGPEGLLFVTRPAAQLPRLLATLQAAHGAALADRTVAWTDGGRFYAAALVGKQPFAPEALDKIWRRLRTRRLQPEHRPDQPARLSLPSQVLAGTELARLEARTGHRLDPPTDDAPFFNRRARLFRFGPEIVGALRGPSRLDLEEQPLAEAALLALLVESALVSAALLLFGRRRARRSGGWRFAVAGLAFMAIEIALVQQLGLLAGAPSRALALTFGGLLLGAGLGAASGRGSPRGAALACSVWAITGGAVVALLLGAPLWLRCVATGIIASGIGSTLGPVLPSLLREADALRRTEGFALNAAASVTGISGALLLAPEVGLSGLAALAAVLYLTLLFRRRR